MIERKVFILLGLLLLSIASFGQETQVKIDTVHIPVYYVRFFDERPLLVKGPIYDIPYKNVVVPASSVRRKKIPLLYHNQKDNKFNGMFMMTEDDLSVYFSHVTYRMKKNSLDFFYTVQGSNMPKYFNNKKKLPKQAIGKFNLYAGYWLDAIWVKYTFTETMGKGPKNYIKNVAGADGATFNYYLLYKVNSSKVL